MEWGRDFQATLQDRPGVDEKTTQEKRTGMFISCPGLGVSPSLVTAKCVLSGNGPSLCACLALVKNHSRVSGLVIPSSKGYYEAVQ